MAQTPPPTPHQSGTRLLYTADQAAELLNVRPSWLRRRATARAVPCTFIGKHLRFSQADIAAIIADGASPSTGYSATTRRSDY